ncbi:hypothetical protein PENSPDRAFT_689266 [Peniophora sp. CONT]|nr:hypothetical protein PENSPDRAFT_689266 [Peniophora sp. CONT]
MAPLNLLDLNDNILRAFCEAAALVHPPHWEFPESGQAHDWEPDSKGGWIDRNSGRVARFCLGWIHISHTCSRLRDIMLDMPSLWAGIIFSLPSRSKSVVKTLVSRAQDCPLHLVLPQERWCALVTQNLDMHAREMSARSMRHGVKKAVLPHYIERAVVLDMWTYEDWTLLGVGTYPRLSVLRVNHSHGYHPRLLAIHAPNLAVLVLASAVPCFPFTKLPCLVKLDLALPGHLDGPESLCLMDTLTRTPSLEELRLIFHWALYPCEDEAPSPFPSATLPSLRSAIIRSDNYSDLHPLWMHIHAPESIKLDIEFDACVPDRAGVLAAASSQLSFGAYSLLKVGIDEHLDLRVESQGDAREGSGVHYREKVCNPARSVETIRLFPSSVNKQRITHIEVNIRNIPIAWDTDWTDLLASFANALSSLPSVVSLTIEGDVLSAIRLWTSWMVSEGTFYSDVFKFLPALHTLTIRLTDYRQYRDRHSDLQLIREVWNGVIWFLVALEAGGTCLQRLSLNGERYRKSSKEVGVIEKRAMRVNSMLVDEIVDERT